MVNEYGSVGTYNADTGSITYTAGNAASDYADSNLPTGATYFIGDMPAGAKFIGNGMMCLANGSITSLPSYSEVPTRNTGAGQPTIPQNNPATGLPYGYTTVTTTPATAPAVTPDNTPARQAAIAAVTAYLFPGTTKAAAVAATPATSIISGISDTWVYAAVGAVIGMLLIGGI